MKILGVAVVQAWRHTFGRANCCSVEPLAGDVFAAVYRPDANPWIRGSSSNGPPPRTASRSRSLKVPIPAPKSSSWLACWNLALFATSPKFQPSP